MQKNNLCLFTRIFWFWTVGTVPIFPNSWVQIWRWAAGYTKMMLQFCILFVITTHLVCAASLRVSGVRRCPRTFWKAESLYFTSITMNLSELQTSRSRGHVAVSQNVKFQDIRNLHRFSLVVTFTLVINSRTNETRFPGAGTSWLRKNKCMRRF